LPVGLSREIAFSCGKTSDFYYYPTLFTGRVKRSFSALTRHKTTRGDSESLHTIAPAGNEKSPGSQAARAFDILLTLNVDR
jgi:hypothetical protein